MRPLFEQRKALLTLLKEGVPYDIKRRQKSGYLNTVVYDENNNYVFEDVGTISAVLHMPNVVSSTGNYTGNHDGYSNMREKKTPILFTTSAEFDDIGVQRNDIVIMNDVLYEIVMARDVNNWGIIYELSLEMIDYSQMIV